MNINISKVKDALSCIENLQGSSMALHVTMRLTFGVIFVGKPLLENVTMFLNVFHLQTISLFGALW